jgi:hypothetical protein
MFECLAQIAKPANEAAGSVDLRPALLLALVVTLIGLSLAMVMWTRRRRELACFGELRRRHGLQRIRDPQELDGIGRTLETLFADLRMIVRQVRILRAYTKRHDPFDIAVVHAVLGNERGNEDPQSLDKMMVLVSGFPEALPVFQLLPGTAGRNAPEKGDVFPPGSLFAEHNYVVGADRPRIRRLLNTRVQDALIPNRDLAVRACPEAMAFYPHGTRILPSKPAEFLERCVGLARLMRGPQPERSVTSG